MQCPILICFSTKALNIRLNLSLHHTTNRNNITTNTRVYKIVFDFTLNSLRHLAGINIINIIFDLLNFQSLVERRPGSVLLRIKNATPTININAPVRRLPLTINKANDNFGFAFMACELN